MKILNQIIMYVLLFLIGLGIGFMGFSGCNKEKDLVTEETFNNANQYLNWRIDTMQWKLDSISGKVDSLMLLVHNIDNEVQVVDQKIDTLKNGQILIYMVLKKMESQPQKATKSFLDRLAELFQF